MLNPTATTVWMAPCPDQPGGLASLLEPLTVQGADLQFLLARRLDNAPGKALVFVSPLDSEKQSAAASARGFHLSPDLHVVRIDGTNEPGAMYQMARAIADERINVRAVSALAIRSQFMAYMAFDTEGDAAKAIRRLNVGL